MCSVRQEQWVYAIATSHTGSIDKISWELAFREVKSDVDVPR